MKACYDVSTIFIFKPKNYIYSGSLSSETMPVSPSKCELIEVGFRKQSAYLFILHIFRNKLLMRFSHISLQMNAAWSKSYDCL